ncbi:cellulase family glycosylhydrolase [bacterium]|nr:cellulase family glycosylhydrolase [bacterium]
MSRASLSPRRWVASHTSAKRRRWLSPTALLFALSLSASAPPAAAQAPVWPTPFFPHGMGVAIHFTGAHKDLDLIADAFSFVRMDLAWDQVETTPGVYRWEGYDALVDAALARGIGLVFILAYGNPLHTEGHSVRTSAEREAFVAFAGAAAARYRGRVLGWEVWNEPNLERFWSPVEDREALYVALLAETAAAVRAADPGTPILGPNIGEVDSAYLEEAMGLGMLAHLDVLTVHPYRDEGPETVIPDYDHIAKLAALHGREGMPVAAGEWGYSLLPWNSGPITPEQQAGLLARRYLVDAIMEAPFSVWYEWRDSGVDELAREENYGTVTNPMEPKPAYYAARALKMLLSGLEPLDLLPGEEGDWLLALGDGTRVRVAAWTVGEPRQWSPPFQVAAAWDIYGRFLDLRQPLTLGPLPIYLEPAKSEFPLLRLPSPDR